MAERVAREAEILCDQRVSPVGDASNHRLAKIKIGIEIALQAGDFDIVEFGREVRNRIVPPDLSICDDFDSGFQLVGDSAARHFIFGIEEVGRVAFAAIASSSGAPENLKFRCVADSRIAASASKVQTGKLWSGR
jgi:hypothetical protein